MASINIFAPNEVQTQNNFSVQYLEILQKDIENNENEQAKINVEMKEINTLVENIKNLSQQPEWPDSFIPINNLAYVSATLIHTGEQYVKFGSEYFTLMSSNETLSYLQRQLKCKQDLLHSYKERQTQLEERLKLYNTNDLSELEETKDMPMEIGSHQGVARKINGYYEVYESYDEEIEKEFYSKRSKQKHKERLQEHDLDANVFFKKLEELEEQEYLNEELGNAETAPINLLEHIRNILKTSGVYTTMVSDETVKQHCAENLNSEAILNRLIINALRKDPVTYSSDQSTSQNTLSDNELKVIEFLDDIEKC